jgi:S-adenosylmethionine:tRNA ribosyltransferase-isomerase
MDTNRLAYKLPKKLIAQKPASPRDAARLMVLSKKNRKITDSTFREIGSFLKKGDVLVLNKTKVFSARVQARKDTGGKIEVVFLAETKPKNWEVIIGGKISAGQKIIFGENFEGVVKDKNQDSYLLEVKLSEKQLLSKLEKIGEVPLPPYIKRKAEAKDKKEYQTVFAQKVGSAAAPTAGLHFTKSLLKKLKNSGIETEYITLHVGLGTFAPIKTDKVEEHPIHSEYFEIDLNTAKRISQAKKEGRRIIACGTTAVRALESSAEILNLTCPHHVEKETKLFIYPSYKFKIVDGLITNFHTPRSSLLALVYAFAGEKKIKNSYGLAIKKKYRFFSYGDGMLII